MTKLLVYGGGGWLGQWCKSRLERRFGEVRYSDARVHAGEMPEIPEDITHVLTFIGRTRGPGCNTIDYLERKGMLPINIRDNIVAPILISEACKNAGVHCTYLGTGCLFQDDRKYTDKDEPNYAGSAYCAAKGATDSLMRALYSDTTLNVRFRMPIVDEDGPYDFITKICTYKRIINEPNSVSVMPSLIGPLMDHMLMKTTGPLHLVNANPLSHGQIMELYKEVVDPEKTWTFFTTEEQNAMLSAPRSNVILEPMEGAEDTETAIRKVLALRK